MPHTPGPWTRGERDNRGWIPIRSSDHRTVAEVICQLPTETESNANLLAASTDLLAAARLAYEPLRRKAETCKNKDWKHVDQVVFDALQNAIWKADGRPR